MDFGKAPTVIFFHIPRTGGSTFWHSLVESLVDTNIDILDTYDMSLTHYGSDLHEQEFFDSIVSSLTLNPRVVHVHTSLDFSNLPENTLLVHGVRNNWPWRKSWIAHNLKIMKRSYINSSKEDDFHFYRRTKEILKIVPGLILNDFDYFLSNPTLKSTRIKKIVYKLNSESMLTALEDVHKYLQTNNEELIIKRFANLESEVLEKHDTEGFLVNFVSIFLLCLSYPFYLTSKILQKGILRIYGHGSTFAQPHESEQGKYEIAALRKTLDIKYGEGLVRQNLLSNPNFEICSFDFLEINKDRTFCANNWYLNRGGEIYFRQFSRTRGRSYPEELETFVEIENKDPQNSFFEIIQEVELNDLPIKLAGEKSIFSFEKRLFGSLSNNAKTYAMVYYNSDEVKDLRLVNTIHEIPHREKSEESIWEKHFFVSRIPKDAEKVTIGILVQSSTGLDTGLGIHLKNMWFGFA